MIGDSELLSRHISKAELSDIARIRLEQIFMDVRERLRASGIAPMSGQRLVLTGGASELLGAGRTGGTDFRQAAASGTAARRVRLAEAGDRAGFRGADRSC